MTFKCRVIGRVIACFVFWVLAAWRCHASEGPIRELDLVLRPDALGELIQELAIDDGQGATVRLLHEEYWSRIQLLDAKATEALDLTGRKTLVPVSKRTDAGPDDPLSRTSQDQIIRDTLVQSITFCKAADELLLHFCYNVQDAANLSAVQLEYLQRKVRLDSLRRYLEPQPDFVPQFAYWLDVEELLQDSAAEGGEIHVLRAIASTCADDSDRNRASLALDRINAVTSKYEDTLDSYARQFFARKRVMPPEDYVSAVPSGSNLQRELLQRRAEQFVPIEELIRGIDSSCFLEGFDELAKGWRVRAWSRVVPPIFPRWWAQGAEAWLRDDPEVSDEQVATLAPLAAAHRQSLHSAQMRAVESAIDRYVRIRDLGSIQEDKQRFAKAMVDIWHINNTYLRQIHDQLLKPGQQERLRGAILDEQLQHGLNAIQPLFGEDEMGWLLEKRLIPNDTWLGTINVVPNQREP